MSALSASNSATTSTTNNTNASDSAVESVFSNLQMSQSSNSSNIIRALSTENALSLEESADSTSKTSVFDKHIPEMRPNLLASVNEYIDEVSST